MKKIIKMIAIAGLATAAASCGKEQEEFKYLVDEFADLKVMRYQVPGWDGLTLQQKEYVYHLAEAAKYGRDIIWMQNCKYNLQVRKAIENILENYKGDRECEDFKDFETYAKRVFFSNGIHHHYAEDKFFPVCSKEYFGELMKAVDAYDIRVLSFIYDYDACPHRKSTDKSKDIVVESSVNFYEGVTKAEVEKFYEEMTDLSDPTPVSYGLNSKLMKAADGTVYEEVYKIGGLYGHALEKICEELEKAAEVAENKVQKQYIDDLINYYKTGDLKLWDEYNIKWVGEHEGSVDFVNGFVEDYNDVVKQAGDSNSKDVLRNAVWMTGITESNENMLSKIGITVGKGNELKLDEEALKKADISALKTLFTGHNSFADKVSMKANSISNAAARYSGTYKSNGTYNNALSELVSSKVDKEV